MASPVTATCPRTALPFPSESRPSSKMLEMKGGELPLKETVSKETLRALLDLLH